MQIESGIENVTDRKWYGQFLVNRADIPSGLDLEKREF